MSKLRDMALIMRDISQITQDLLRVQIDHIAVTYKQIISRLLSWLLMVLVSIILGLGGISLMIYSLYVHLGKMIGPSASAVLIGTVLVMVAIIVFLLARAKIKE